MKPVVLEKTILGKTFTTIRLKVQSTIPLNELSNKVQMMARKYEVPIDIFSDDHFHIGLGRYESQIDEKVIKSIVDTETIILLTVEKLGVYYSMFNEPKPEKAIKIAAYPFRK
jgi:hypothetical protein